MIDSFDQRIKISLFSFVLFQSHSIYLSTCNRLILILVFIWLQCMQRLKYASSPFPSSSSIHVLSLLVITCAILNNIPQFHVVLVFLFVNVDFAWMVQGIARQHMPQILLQMLHPVLRFRIFQHTDADQLSNVENAGVQQNHAELVRRHDFDFMRFACVQDRLRQLELRVAFLYHNLAGLGEFRPGIAKLTHKVLLREPMGRHERQRPLDLQTLRRAFHIHGNALRPRRFAEACQDAAVVFEFGHQLGVRIVDADDVLPIVDWFSVFDLIRGKVQALFQRHREEFAIFQFPVSDLIGVRCSKDGDEERAQFLRGQRFACHQEMQRARVPTSVAISSTQTTFDLSRLGYGLLQRIGFIRHGRP
mmetsp:Transcript_3529/g.10089  ORF Transcript_3529/g.10089 Transcript_3529/m.10089 type:complete len:362 (+) Transcript_3529:112-1197(+)